MCECEPQIEVWVVGKLFGLYIYIVSYYLKMIVWYDLDAQNYN